MKYCTTQRFTSTCCEAESPTHFVSRHTTGSTRTLYCSTSLPLLFALAGLADQRRHQLQLGASCLVQLLHLVGGRVALAPSSRRTTGARVHKAFPRVSWVCTARGSSAGGVVRVRPVCLHHPQQRPTCRPCRWRRLTTPHPRRTTRTYSQVAALSGELVAAALFSLYIIMTKVVVVSEPVTRCIFRIYTYMLLATAALSATVGLDVRDS